MWGAPHLSYIHRRGGVLNTKYISLYIKLIWLPSDVTTVDLDCCIHCILYRETEGFYII